MNRQHPLVRMGRPRYAAVLSTSALGMSISAIAAPYTVRDLGTLHGAPQALAITSSGMIVGFAPDASASYRAVQFGGASPFALGTVNGFTQSVALTAHDGDPIILGGYTLGGLSYGAASIGSSTLLGAFLPRSVNASGVVAGIQRVATPDGFVNERACQYSTGVLITLPTLGGASSVGLGINSAGWVVGSSFTAANDRPHAFVWLGGIASDLGALGTPAGVPAMSQAIAINDAREVVGVSSTTSGAMHACRWTLAAGGSVFSRTDLGTLRAGASSVARAVNAAGEIVGTSDDRAFIYAGSTLTDLNLRLPAGSGWVLEVAGGINDAGQIVGWGMHDGSPAAFLLSASAACNPADITGAGGTYVDGAVSVPPDGQLTIEDFLSFLSAFGDATGCPGTAPCNPADIAGAGATYMNGTVDIGPDGQLTIEDFLIFLSAFGDAAGCP